jgi:alanine dehydrogenase
MGRCVPVAPLLFDDDDVRARLDAASAVHAVRAALVAQHAGTLRAPARVRAGLGDGDLVFTAGHLREEGLFGFRAYDTLAGGEQLVAVWDAGTGELRALVHGDELGARRTGAIGAVAVDAAANPGPVTVGLLGTGAQAWTQLWALSAVRPIENVVVTSRDRHRGGAFTDRAVRELGVKARWVAAVEEAVHGRDVVIVATGSPEPVLDADWISAGTHVTTLGPKTVLRHELPPALFDRADVVVNDSRVQAAGDAEPQLFDAGRMVELGAVLAGAEIGRSDPGQITGFCSVGLAGTEIAVAAALLGPAPRPRLTASSDDEAR